MAIMVMSFYRASQCPKTYLFWSNDSDVAVGINTLRDWLQPEDPVLAHITEATTALAREREEATCLWVKSYLTQFLKGEQRLLSIIGKPGAGKSVLSSVINDHLQHPVGGMRYTSILAPISQSCWPHNPYAPCLHST